MISFAKFDVTFCLVFTIVGYTHALKCYVCSGSSHECLERDRGGKPTDCDSPEAGNDVFCRLATKEIRNNHTIYFKECSYMLANIEKIVPLCQLDDVGGGTQDILCFCKHDLCNNGKTHCIKDNKVCYDDGNPDNIKKKYHEPHKKPVHDH